MKRKSVIVGASVVGLLVLAVLGGEAFLKYYVRKTIENALSDTGATVEVGRVAVSLPRRQVAAHDVKVVLQNNDATRRGSTLVSLDASLESVTARGIGFKKTGGLPAVRAERVILETPRATVVTKGEEAPGISGTPTASKNPVGAISEKLSSLDIGLISITDAALEYVEWLSDSDNTRLSFDGADLSMSDVTLDAPPVDIRMRVDSIVYGFGAGSKTLRADSVALDSSKGTLALGGFALVPTFPKNEFARLSKTHEDWTSITLGPVSCTGVDFNRLIRDRALAIDSVSLVSAEIASYKNRKVYQPPRDKLMLYQSIRRLPIPVDIKTLSFEKLDVVYDELSENGSSPGRVTLTGGNGKATNVTNIAEEHDRFMTVDLAATLMNSGAVQVRFLFPIAASDDHWEMRGRLGAIDAKAFNGAVEPLVNARLTAGRIHGMDFSVTGDSVRSHCALTMIYNDLHVEFLDKRDHRKRGFLTFLADDVLIRSDNPGRDGRGKLREAEGDYTRDPQRSMWHCMWHSIFVGIRKTVI